MLTEDQVVEIEKREKAASPGKWEAVNYVRADGSPMRTIDDVVATLEQSARKGTNPVLFGVDNGQSDVVLCYTGNGPTSACNAHFMAEAKHDIPALLRDWRKMKKVVEAARTVADAGAISVYSYTGPVSACRKALAELDGEGE